MEWTGIKIYGWEKNTLIQDTSELNIYYNYIFYDGLISIKLKYSKQTRSLKTLAHSIGIVTVQPALVS